MRRLTLLPLLMLSLWPAVAGAAPVPVPTKGVPSGGDLGGEDVFYGAIGQGGNSEIRAIGPGGDRLIRSFSPAPPTQNPGESDALTYSKTVVFTASAGVLATRVTQTASVKGFETQRSTQFDFGPLAGPYTTYDDCPQGPAHATDGNRIAITRCSQGVPQRVEVLDVVAGTTLVTIENATVIALAGDRLLFARDKDVIVWDVVANAEVYRVSGEPVSAWGLQADGKLVQTPLYDAAGVFIPLADCHQVYWRSPGEPQANFVRGCATSTAPKLAGDRIVFQTRENGKTTLVLAQLDGAQRRFGGEVDAFDWDGIRALYGCDGKLYLDDLAGSPDEPPVCVEPDTGDDGVRGCHPDDTTARQVGSRRCPVDLVTRSVKVDSRGRAVLRLRCAIGCRGNVRLRRRVNGRFVWISRSTRISIGDDGSRTYRIKLTARPPAGAGWRAEAVARSQNRVSGSRQYVRSLRLVR